MQLNPGWQMVLPPPHDCPAKCHSTQILASQLSPPPGQSQSWSGAHSPPVLQGEPRGLVETHLAGVSDLSQCAPSAHSAIGKPSWSVGHGCPATGISMQVPEVLELKLHTMPTPVWQYGFPVAAASEPQGWPSAWNERQVPLVEPQYAKTSQSPLSTQDMPAEGKRAQVWVALGQ